MVKLKADFEADWTAQIKRRMTERWGTEVAQIKDRDVAAYYFESFRRSITKQSRDLRIADDFHCPSQEEAVWKALQHKIVGGGDLNPHLSARHRSLFNRDGMLAEWGVHHFHLGTELDPRNPNYVKRSGLLVFALVDEHVFYAINVHRHGEWELPSIVETLHRNWPEAISKYQLRGIRAEELQPQERRTLRKNGLQAAVSTADGTIYGSIGGPISCAGVKFESRRNADIWAHQIRGLQSGLQDQLCRLMPTLEQRGYAGEAEIEAELTITKDGYQAFFPKYRVRATLLIAEPI